jgi:hypothetical protein
MHLSTIEYAKARFSTVAEVARALRVSNMTVYRRPLPRGAFHRSRLS